MSPDQIAHKLRHAATAYDQRVEAADLKARRRVNIYRLSIILGVIDERILPDMATHGDLRRAICENTNDRLRDALLRGVDMPIWRNDGSDFGRK